MSAQILAEFISRFGINAVLVSLALSLGIAIAGILPSVFITAANVLVFGPLYGFVVSLAGEVIGACVSFYLYQAGFRRHFTAMSRKHAVLDKLVQAGGVKAGWLLFQARLFPFVPSGIVTLAAAVSKMRFSIFLIATATGKIPSILLEAMVSYDFINLNKNWLRLLFVILSLLLLLLILKLNPKEKKL